MSATVNGLTNTRLIGPLVATVAMGAVAVANFAGSGENGGAGPFAVSAVIIVLLALVLFGRVIPRALEDGRPARIALILAGAAVLTLVGFWSGLPQVLAPAAVVLGLAAPRSSESTAAVAIGAAAYGLSLVACVIG